MNLRTLPTAYLHWLHHEALAAIAALPEIPGRTIHNPAAPTHEVLHEVLRDFEAVMALPTGHWLEFGVGAGDSLRMLVARRPRGVIGFDSFKGLPSDWRPGFPEGSFAVAAIPEFEGAADLVVGLFADTVPVFVRERARTWGVSLMHVDCDLYESTACVLEHVGPCLNVGAIVVFDELAGYPGFEHHEMLALWEAHERGMRWAWLARGKEGVAIRITQAPGPLLPTEQITRREGQRP